MDKISGIVPSSPRVQAVDIKEAGAVRPGTPGFGRPEGMSTGHERVPFDGMRKSSEMLNFQNEQKRKDQMLANIAADQSKKFFMTNMDRGAPTQMTSTEKMAQTFEDESYDMKPTRMSMDKRSVPTGFKGVETDRAHVASLEDNEEEEFYPRGSFLDRKV